MECNTTEFSGHALRRMFDRGITMDEVVAVICYGEVIAAYQDDRPYPSCLLLGIVNDRPIHVVIARNEKDYACYVVTAYVPSTRLWSNGFRTRRQQ